MTIDKQKLKALAEDAVTFAGLNGEVSPAQEDFIAATSPATIRDLLAEIEEDAMHMRAFGEVMRSQAEQIDQLKAENEALRKDAERYRFVSKLAWYVDRAAQVYDLCNVNSNWRTERGSPDEDDVEGAIDATMAKVASHG